MPAFIEAVELRKTYRVGKIDVPALRGISFSVKKGELVRGGGKGGRGKEKRGEREGGEKGEEGWKGEREGVEVGQVGDR